MNEVKTSQRKSYLLIAALMAIILVTSLACNLLSLGDDEPEQTTEQPTEVPTLVVNQEIEEPAQEEPTPEPVAEEVQPTEEPVQEEVQAPVITSDELFLTGQQALVFDEYSTYGVFMVKNPKTDCTYESAQYTMVVYDDQNQQINTEDGYLEMVLPSSEMVEIVYFSDDSDGVDHYEITLAPGTCTTSPFDNTTISFAQPMIFSDDNYPSASAQIINGLDSYQTDLYVVAVGFDASNQIVAVGSNYVNILPPSDSSGVMVNMNTSEGTTLDHVTFYGTQSYFSETSIDEAFFDTTYLDEYVGSIQIEDEVELIFFLQNDDPAMAASDIEYQVTLYDGMDNVIAVETGYIDHILPGDYSAEYITAYLPEGITYESYYVQLTPGEFVDPLFPSNPFTADNFQYDDSDYFPVATFDLGNSSAKAVSDLGIIIALYDVDSHFIGGGTMTSDTINPNSVTNQEAYVNVAGEPDSMEVFLVIDYWTEVAE